MAVDRIRQQRTPSQFGADATSLSDPNVSHASFATPGVVDRSKGMGYQAVAIGAQGAGIAASAAIQLGQEVKEGFALADLESEQEQVINDYMESKKNPQIAADSIIDAATLESTSHALWNKLGEGASIEDVDAIEKQYKNKLDMLNNANKQGVMSPDEFAQRTMAVTREAINRNPHLYNDILAHSKKVLGLSGIESVLEADKNIKENDAKQFQKRIETAMQISKENNIPHRYLSDGSFDLAHAEKMNAVVQQEKFGADAIARLADYQNNTEKLQAAEFIRGANGTTALNGVINQAKDILISVMRDPQNKTDQLTFGRQLFDGLKQQLRDRAGPLMHLPGVKDQLEYAEKHLDSTLSTMEKFASKEDQLKFLENHSNMIRNQQFQELSKKINMEEFKAMTQIMSTTGIGRLLDRDPTIMSKIQDTLGNVLSGVSNGLGTDYSLRDGNGKNVLATAIDTLAGNATNGDSSSSAVLGKTIETIWADTKSQKFPSVEEKFKFYDGYMKALGNQVNKDGFKGLSEVALGKASENLEEYMQLTLGGLQKDLAAVSGKGTEVKLSMLPDGRLNIQTSNPTDTDLLLKKYGIRINEGLRVFSNLTGTDTKKAAEILYPQYDVLKGVSENPGFGNRTDGSIKGNGFLGPLKRPDGGVSTELSIGVNLNNKEMEIPLLVPSLTKPEIDHLLADGKPTEAIVNKAVNHARKRIEDGKSPFAEIGESPKQKQKEGKPNETNPLNLTIPGQVGKFQSFDNVEEGIRAASVQLDRYFTGKTTGKALKTVSDIAGLWNNEKEPGSASKKDYVATIVKHSGLDPNETLDLTNPSIKADLIYGMAVAEGKRLRPSQILAALGNM